MGTRCWLRKMREADHFEVKEVYADAIESQGDNFYTKAQIQAWSSLAWLPGVLDKPLVRGRGWLMVEKYSVEAFAVRYPVNRLALLYCRGRSSRQGYAKTLLAKLESEARQEGENRLITEASLFSYPLLLRCGWTLLSNEVVQIGGISFERYRMEKRLYSS